MADEQFHPRGNKQTNKKDTRSIYLCCCPIRIVSNKNMQEQAKEQEWLKKTELQSPHLNLSLLSLMSLVEKKMFTFKLRNRHLSEYIFKSDFHGNLLGLRFYFIFYYFSSFID